MAGKAGEMGLTSPLTPPMAEFLPRPPNLEAAGKTNPRPARLEFSILRVLDQDAVPKVDPVVLPALTANCDRFDDDPVGGAMRHAPQSHA